MIAVEAHASGRPVIALSRGGAIETVIPEVNGLLFEEETAASLVKAVQQFEAVDFSFDPPTIKQTAAPFDEECFEQGLTRFVGEKVQEHRNRFKAGRRQP